MLSKCVSEIQPPCLELNYKGMVEMKKNQKFLMIFAPNSLSLLEIFVIYHNFKPFFHEAETSSDHGW